MKKLILSLILVSLTSLYSNAQESTLTWREMMLHPKYSLFEVQKAFYKELGDRPYESIKGYKHFKRWEERMLLKVDKNGYYDNLKTIRVYKHFKEKSITSQARETNTWTPIGPFNRPGINGIGRVNVIAFHPTNTNILWAGTPAGGLWKSSDGGVNWITNSDNFPNLGVSDIAIQSSNPNIMYIGTGDRDNMDTYSYGLIKSTDGGNSWTLTSLPIGTQNLIHRVLINPSNPNILLVATSNGLYTLDIWNLIRAIPI